VVHLHQQAERLPNAASSANNNHLRAGVAEWSEHWMLNACVTSTSADLLQSGSHC
jgi:hypothetical protein